MNRKLKNGTNLPELQPGTVVRMRIPRDKKWDQNGKSCQEMQRATFLHRTQRQGKRSEKKPSPSITLQRKVQTHDCLR